MKLQKLIVIFLLVSACNTHHSPSALTESVVQIQDNLRTSVEIFSNLRTETLISPSSIANGEVKMVSSKDWASGFFSGELWMMYELTSDPYWKEKALGFTLPLEQEKWNSKTHTIGLKMYASFGKAWKHTQNPEYRDILIQSAKTLATRFKPNVGCIRSWDHSSEKWDFPVVIENMMDLELLLWAAKETGNELYKEIAVRHAETTMQNHFRKDNSSYHLIDYNSETGEVQNRNTAQGFSDESAWSCGQAWGLYGFTMVYRETGDEKFLKQAEKIANYILSHPNLPKNLIPYWDFDAPNIPDEPNDVLAAAVLGSALFELSTFSQNRTVYALAANKIYDQLLSIASHNKQSFLLKHESDFAAEVNAPLVSADYYLVEMIVRKSRLVGRNL